MPTPIGVNTVTSIARHFIMPTITDNIYKSNVLLYRLMRMNKRIVRGGTQIEVPLMYQRFNSGGPYRGLDVFNTAPSDTIKNAVFDWKQHYVSWSVDGLTLIKVDSPDAIANYLRLQSEQAYMEMAENLAVGLFSNGVTNVKDIEGLNAIHNNSGTYGGIPRATNTWWQTQLVTAAVAMTNAALQSMFQNATIGGQHPTLILSRSDQYNRFYALNASSATGYNVQYVRQPMGHDELLASAGFTNLLFNNVPWVVDSHVPDGSVLGGAAANSTTYFINENVLAWVVSPRADFYLKPFVEPANQDAMVSSLLYAGNLVNMQSQLQGAHAGFNA